MVAHEHDRTTNQGPRRTLRVPENRMPRRPLVGPSLGLQAWTDYLFKVAWRLLGISAAVAALGAGESVLRFIHGFVH